MELEQILTNEDFYQFVRQLSKTQATEYAGTLDDYLRSLLRVVTQRRTKHPTFQLLAHVLLDSFTTTPIPFDPAWLAYTEPPQFLTDPRMDQATRPNPFDELQQMLRYQIADLAKLRETGEIDKPYALFGLCTPGGHYWYNFNPADFLECAASGIEHAHDLECSWEVLAILLWLGQIYE